MKYSKFALLLAIFTSSILFSFKNIEPSSNSEIYGTWVNTGYEDGASVYTKRNKFKRDRPGMKFNKNGKLIKRQNMGWCGTPPISYSNYNGSWSETADNTIRIEYEYWGGVDTAFIQIVSLDDTMLKIKLIHDQPSK